MNLRAFQLVLKHYVPSMSHCAWTIWDCVVVKYMSQLLFRMARSFPKTRNTVTTLLRRIPFEGRHLRGMCRSSLPYQDIIVFQSLRKACDHANEQWRAHEIAVESGLLTDEDVNGIVELINHFLRWHPRHKIARRLVERQKQSFPPPIEFEPSCEPCSVCMEQKRLEVLECGHTFCKQCLLCWSPRTCPLCRQPFIVFDNPPLDILSSDLLTIWSCCCWAVDNRIPWEISRHRYGDADVHHIGAGVYPINNVFVGPRNTSELSDI
jgi:hypothetical protein